VTSDNDITRIVLQKQRITRRSEQQPAKAEIRLATCVCEEKK